MADSEFLKSVGIASEEGYNRMEVSYANVEFLNLTIESLLRDQRALEQMAAKANRLRHGRELAHNGRAGDFHAHPYAAWRSRRVARTAHAPER